MNSRAWLGAGAVAALIAAGLVGCQTWTGNMTLPSPNYLQHYPQYFPAEPSFPLARETAGQEKQPPTVVPVAAAGRLPAPVAASGPATPSPQAVPVASTIPASVPPPSPAAGTADEQYVAELLKILDETKSADTLIVTLQMLKAAKADPRRVVPAAIRNAERVGVFDNHLFGEETAEAAAAQGVAEVIAAFTDAKKGPRSRAGRTGATALGACGGGGPGTAAGALIGSMTGSGAGAIAGALTEAARPADPPVVGTPVLPPPPAPPAPSGPLPGARKAPRGGSSR